MVKELSWVERNVLMPLENQIGYEEFMHEYTSALKEMHTKVEILSGDFAVHHNYNPIHHVERRLKTAASLEEKLERFGFEKTILMAREHIYDVAGLRIVVNFLDDVYKMEEMLLAQNDISLIMEKDYIKNPKANGYRSLHLAIKVPVFLLSGWVSVPVEVQIRTVAMDFWASLEHNLRYKQDNEITPKINLELKACAEVSATLDKRMQKIYDEIYPINKGVVF